MTKNNNTVTKANMTEESKTQKATTKKHQSPREESKSKKSTSEEVRISKEARRIEVSTLFAKLFGGLNLTWPRLLIASVVVGIFVGLLMAIPSLVDTSLTRIGVIFYWWILFGVIIITNSKSHIDSALKCFAFFLISQPLIYLTQILIGSADWSLMGYYRNWVLWTFATLPMGYIGYWLKKQNTFSAVILSGALIFIGVEALGEFNFSRYLLSGIFCILIMTALLLGVLKNWKLRAISVAIAAIAIPLVLFIFGAKPEDYIVSLTFDVGEDYGVTTEAEWRVESSEYDSSHLWLDIEPEYDENGDKTDKTFYYLKFTGNGYDFGEHSFKLISDNRALDCSLTIAEKNEGTRLECK